MFGRRPETGFFEEMESMMERMNLIMGQMMHPLNEEAQVFGYTMQVGPDGIPHMEYFGNVQPNTDELTEPSGEPGFREPFTSIVVDKNKNELYLTAEMPGVEKANIEVSAATDEVLIKAGNGERKYNKTVKTQVEVEPDSATAKYNNGVLEVTLKLKTFMKPEGKSIKVE